MVDQTTIIIAVVSLVSGLIAGSLLTRTISPQSVKTRELKKKLLEKDEELKIYRRDVNEHFVKSAELLREMTRTQRETSEQLATAAMRLASPEVSRMVHDTAFDGLALDTRFNFLSAVPPEPPKDYAPSVPGGVLSESYGLSDLQDNGTTRGLFDAKPFDTKPSAASDDRDDDPTFKIS